MREINPAGREQRSVSDLGDTPTPLSFTAMHNNLVSQFSHADPETKKKFPFLSPDYNDKVAQTTQGYIDSYYRIGATSPQHLANEWQSKFFGDEHAAQPLPEAVERRICQAIEETGHLHFPDDLSDKERYDKARELLKDKEIAATISQGLLNNLLTPSEEDQAQTSDKDSAATLSATYFFTMLSGNDSLYEQQALALKHPPNNKYRSKRLRKMIQQTGQVLEAARPSAQSLQEKTEAFLTLPRTDWINYLGISDRGEELLQQYTQAAEELGVELFPTPKATEEPTTLLEVSDVIVHPKVQDDWAPEEGYEQLNHPLYPTKPEPQGPRDKTSNKKTATRDKQPRSTLRPLVEFRKKLSPDNVFELCDNTHVLDVDGHGLNRPPQNEYSALQFRKLDSNGNLLFKGSIADNPVDGYMIFYRTDTSKTGASPKKVARCSPQEAQRIHGAQLLLHVAPDGIDPDDCMQQKIEACYNASTSDYPNIQFLGLGTPGPDGQPRIRVYFGSKMGGTALRAGKNGMGTLDLSDG